MFTLKSSDPETGKISIVWSFPVCIELDVREAALLKERLKQWNKQPFRSLKKFSIVGEDRELTPEEKEELKKILADVPEAS